MARYELKLPKMGESVAEATITSWVKEVGETIDIDDTVVEVATDKVDSEVPSEVEGTLVEILFEKDAVVQVGETIAIIETEGEEGATADASKKEEVKPETVAAVEKTVEVAKETVATTIDTSSSDRFYSPLVKSIAQTEGISVEELENIKGTGKEGRVTKNDILSYLENRGSQPEVVAPASTEKKSVPQSAPAPTPVSLSGQDEIIEMSRMGKLISKHMVDSIQTSAHVQSFIEIDVTNIVNWRNKVKKAYQQREGEKLTFTPIFMQAVASTIKKHPMINISVDGDKIIKRGNVNLGMAAALPDGNLIVPVIKNADMLNLVGMTKQVNDLATRARANKLKPDEIQGGTYTVTNVGSFGSITGTPIINQPQVAILALGAIVKKPAVIETPEGDFIGIRHKMIVSHSYDHRVVNGALGGMFIKTLKEILESWDVNQDF
ncbi:2-oxoglutarate dehydrogenase E2 component (dihydrolipoamide succinyltransferase) [Tenacibaculum mesophilum]|uniref:Dihydrolipoamide acetyltransferase component of pyruvate dehydrogenase complex n=2 Tax=Tenacibaculum TaxID=104267 RepID=A0ABN5T6V3_9FLAO|nr:dihydrolipoamide acetyltransferase family protein [Tenacibaculum mesophilum]AZJ31999.1 2-oxo acid dehydrogenase subunit E2 [Tenacibaculum mesophilum]QFS27256.1 2-oxo acid dehydrogenase subunit E2 [Tenacibaculum mesophilum]SHF88141.1 2-oxoglutarate dehydrogenase E2 component (dihydrolipoamide succinyltransferase) [Tenacibaculum mesophilum]BFF38052.1 dihydrolipoamide acetyltransferase family protein [Tenacibaculum mesophilum]BFF41470.1 dihydrolipoamide acetyltransferase family protein [Tenaci